MSEKTNSHVQQGMETWKKIVDKQVEVASSMTEEMSRLRKLGFERASENANEFQRMSKESLEHFREMADMAEPAGAWNDLMSRQLEAVTGWTRSMGEIQTDGIEKTKATFETVSKLSETSLDHASKLNKAWSDAAIETTKRFAGWMPPSP